MSKATATNVPEAVYGPGYTTEIGGSRFALWGEDVINPVGWGQIWNAKPLAYPSVPSMYGMPMASPTSTSASNSTGASNAIASPLSFSSGIVPWLIVGVVAVGALHFLHWKEPKREEKEVA